MIKSSLEFQFVENMICLVKPLNDLHERIDSNDCAKAIFII
jgi:hypothetical protein